jgi:hypothetical protein
MATKPELNKAVVYEKIKANKYNENFDILLNYIEEVSDELMLKVNTINSQLSSSILSNLQSVYPIGSLYIGVTDVCPIANLFGTWEKVSEGRVLQGASGEQIVGDVVEAELPNITGQFAVVGGRSAISSGSGAFEKYGSTGAGSHSDYTYGGVGCNFNASKSNPIYKDGATVQPPAYLVNIWKRTA